MTPTDAAQDAAPADAPAQTMKSRMLYRSLGLELRALPAEGAEEGAPPEFYEFPISSEAPIRQWFGIEVLGHSKDEVDLSRLKARAAVRDDHRGDQVGVVEKAWLEERRVWVRVRFSKNVRAQEIKRDIDDGIRSNVSVGYVPGNLTLTKANNEGTKEYRERGWQPAHVAITPDPVDFERAGIGRGMDDGLEYDIQVTGGEPATEGRAMGEDKKTPTPPEGGDGGGVATATVTIEERNQQILELMELAKKHQMEDRVPDWIKRGITPREIGAGLDLLASKTTQPIGSQPPTDDPFEGLSERDRKTYSPGRAILMARRIQEGLKGDGVEWEMHRHLERGLPEKFERHGGILLPLRDPRLTPEERWQRAMKMRAMGTAVAGAGAELVFDAAPRELLEVLIPKNVILAMGGTLIPGARGAIPIPKLTTDPTIYHVGENPASAVAASQLGTDVVWLTGKTLQGNVPVPRQLLVMASFDVNAIINRRLAVGIARAMDRGGLHGKGSDHEPLGLYNTAGVTAVAIGGAPTFGKMVDMTTEVADNDADFGSLGFATTPRIAGKLRQTTVISNAAAGFVWTGRNDNGEVAGYRAMASNQVRSDLGAGANEHGILFGNFNDAVFVIFGDAIEVVTDTMTLADKGQVRVIPFAMYDFVAQRPESFSKATGATAA